MTNENQKRTGRAETLAARQSPSGRPSEPLPKVSVAIITYNQHDFLRACIESVMAQDYPHVEFVVADDGSSDGTQEYLRELHRRFPDRVIISLSVDNRGITRNSNAALAACTGKYIAWLGGDDLMLPGKLRKQVEYLESRPDHVICYHDLDVFDSATGKSLKRFNSGPGSAYPYEGSVERLVEYGTFLGACSVMVRRSACPPHGFDERIPIASDWLFWIETAVNGKIGYLDEVLGRYRRHAANVSATSRDCTEELITLGIVESKYPALARYCRRNRSLRLRWAASVSLASDDPQRALEYLAASVHDGGISTSTVKGWLRCLLRVYAPAFLEKLDRVRGRV